MEVQESILVSEYVFRDLEDSPDDSPTISMDIHNRLSHQQCLNHRDILPMEIIKTTTVYETKKLAMREWAPSICNLRILAEGFLKDVQVPFYYICLNQYIRFRIALLRVVSGKILSA